MKLKCILVLCFALIAFATSAQKTSDYIVKLNGDTIYGKVTYAPGSSMNFKETGKKQSITYSPFLIRGYQRK